MDIKQLEAFVYVVETGSFSRAGELLHLTQPTISAHVAALEQELRIKLILRTTKETCPSEAGRLLYDYAKKILQTREEAVEAISGFSRNMTGTVTVAASSIPGQYFLPKLLQSFREKYPDIRFLNREEDLGIDGLRQAKQSYHPHHMVKIYWASLTEDENED